jgi:hypothetical protein
MGASCWSYVVDYVDDPQEMLDELHKAELAEGNYYWCQPETPKPATFQDLHQLYRRPENELIATNGTHSILNVFRLLPTGTADDYGTIVPLTPEQVQKAFGTAEPSREQFEIAYADNSTEDRIDTDIQRWSGRYTPLFQDGAPRQFAVWGVSGD